MRRTYALASVPRDPYGHLHVPRLRAGIDVFPDAQDLHVEAVMPRRGAQVHQSALRAEGQLAAGAVGRRDQPVQAAAEGREEAEALGLAADVHLDQKLAVAGLRVDGPHVVGVVRLAGEEQAVLAKDGARDAGRWHGVLQALRGLELGPG